MAKWYGIVGYGADVEVRPAVWKTVITEKKYSGDLIQNNRLLQTSDKVNDDINISNKISIIADPFAYENASSIRFVEFMGAMWKVNTIDVQYPRLILSVGGVYNGERA